MSSVGFHAMGGNFGEPLADDRKRASKRSKRSMDLRTATCIDDGDGVRVVRAASVGPGPAASPARHAASTASSRS
eukprot:CAMPEP_0170753430 /NCGR_PEP_ID=MMETSP0437-20130122/12488_1 /TAXON_ID=0 /ORGANISM="Sexangularia sp." /LENGTH=74 /DNA_ID=CAMNT_0011092547 /DNA_START=92 /DNA_END=312 /DNA_ORIENTATION=-